MRILATVIQASLCSLLLWAVASPRKASATPHVQSLVKSSSSVKFGVDSAAPTLQMNGQLQDFSGTLSLTEDGSAISQLQVTLNVGSAQLPPDQFLQSMLLHSVIARFQQQKATFKSTTIEHIRGNQYVATGSAMWQNRPRAASIPFHIIKVSPAATEIKVLMRGGLGGKTPPPELLAAGPEATHSTGWARATLLFIRSQLS